MGRKFDRKAIIALSILAIVTSAQHIEWEDALFSMQDFFSSLGYQSKDEGNADKYVDQARRRFEGMKKELQQRDKSYEEEYKTLEAQRQESEKLRRAALTPEERLNEDWLKMFKDLKSKLSYQRLEYDVVLPMSIETHEFALKNFGAGDPRAIESMQIVGPLLIAHARYTDAYLLLDQQLDIIQKAYGEKDERLIETFKQLGRAEEGRNNQKEALKWLQKALELATERKGESDPVTLSVIDLLANHYYEVEYEKGKAEALWDKLHVGIKMNKGFLAYDYVESLQRLAVLKRNRGEYVKAHNIYRTITPLFKNMGDQWRYRLVPVLIELGYMQMIRRYEDDAKKWLDKAWGYIRQGTRTHPDTRRALAYQEVLYLIRLASYQAGYNMSAAMESLGKALKQIEELKVHPDGKANEHAVDWEVLRAEEPRVVSRRRENQMERLRQLEGMARSVMGTAQYDQGKLDEALSSFQQAKRLLDKDSPQQADDTFWHHVIILHHMAEIFEKREDYREAEAYYKKAYDYVLTDQGEDTMSMAYRRRHLALFYMGRERFNEAEKYLELAAAAFEKLAGETYFETITTQVALAHLHYTQGSFSKADEKYSRVIGAVAREMKPDEYGLPTLLIAHAAVLARMGEWERSQRRLEERLQADMNKLFMSFASGDLPAHQRELERAAVYTLGLPLSLAIQRPSKEVVRFTADNFLRWLRIHEEGERHLVRFVNRSRDEQVVALREERKSLLSSNTIAKDNNDQKRMRQLNHQLASLAWQGESALPLMEVDHQRVREALPEKSGFLALHVFTWFDLENGNWQEQHVAGIFLRAGLEEPLLVHLGKVDTILSFAEMLRMESADPAMAEVAESSLHTLLLQPFAGQMKDLDTLYLALDQKLSPLPLARLRQEGGRYWWETIQPHLVRSAHNLLRQPDQNAPVGGFLLAMGGIDFGKYPSRETEDKFDAGRMAKDMLKTLLNRPMYLTTDDDDHLQRIVEDHSGAGQGEMNVLRGKEAREEVLKQRTSSMNVLLVSSRGELRRFRVRDRKIGGLPLADANRGIMGEVSTGGEDGILELQEARNLDLEETELVILDLVPNHGAPGVFEAIEEMANALGIAGARRVLYPIMTTKQSADQKFVERFHARLHATPGHDPGNALSLSRLSYLGEKDSVPKDPRVWAAWRLVERMGDRPLAAR